MIMDNWNFNVEATSRRACGYCWRGSFQIPSVEDAKAKRKRKKKGKKDVGERYLIDRCGKVGKPSSPPVIQYDAIKHNIIVLGRVKDADVENQRRRGSDVEEKKKERCVWEE